MKCVILCALFITFSVAFKCSPKYHHWRPYNGTIPSDAFLAGVDSNGTRNFVAKIIPLDQYLWTIPAQLREGQKRIYMQWMGHERVEKVDQFIEILCSDNPSKLVWERVDQYPDELADRCCYVEGGIDLFDRHVYNVHIAKISNDGEIFIGRSYTERVWPGLHTMNGTRSMKFFYDFDVLTYDCLSAVKAA